MALDELLRRFKHARLYPSRKRFATLSTAIREEIAHGRASVAAAQVSIPTRLRCVIVLTPAGQFIRRLEIRLAAFPTPRGVEGILATTIGADFCLWGLLLSGGRHSLFLDFRFHLPGLSRPNENENSSNE
jgi:hypothetical protein